MDASRPFSGLTRTLQIRPVMSARDPPCSMNSLFNCPISEPFFEPRQAIGGGFFDLDQRNKPREEFSFRNRASFWSAMMRLLSAF
jgi:hypothetical protein